MSKMSTSVLNVAHVFFPYYTPCWESEESVVLATWLLNITVQVAHNNPQSEHAQFLCNASRPTLLWWLLPFCWHVYTTIQVACSSFYQSDCNATCYEASWKWACDHVCREPWVTAKGWMSFSRRTQQYHCLTYRYCCPFWTVVRFVGQSVDLESKAWHWKPSQLAAYCGKYAQNITSDLFALGVSGVFFP